MLIYCRVNCAFSAIFALSRTHMSEFQRLGKKTAVAALHAPCFSVTRDGFSGFLVPGSCQAGFSVRRIIV